MYLVLTGTSKGLTGLRVLERTCSVEWSCGIVHIEIFLLRWRRGCRSICLNLEKNLQCLRLLLSLSLSLSLSHTQLNSTHSYLYLAFLYLLSLYTRYYFICLHLFTPRKQLSTSTFNQEQSWKKVQNPSQGIRLHFLVVICAFIFVSLSFFFNFRI